MTELHTQGSQLVDEHGTLAPYVGVSFFPGFSRFRMRDGWNALNVPLLDEIRAAAKVGGWDDRWIVLRVFRYAAYWNAFALDPWSYLDASGGFSAITDYTQRCLDRGFLIDWTCGDAQAVLPDQDGPRGQQEHQNKTCAALAALPAFVQRCNERFKNGVADGVTVPKWGPYLTCSGDYGEVQNWPWAVFDVWDYHGGRDSGGLYPWPKWLIDMDDQAATLVDTTQKFGRLGEPRRLDEIPGEDNRADLWFEMGKRVTKSNGVTLHSQYGRDGHGFTNAPVTRAGFEAFFAGAMGAIG